MPMILNLLLAFLLVSSSFFPSQSDAATESIDPAPVTSKKPYSVPWQLRPILPADVLRFDTAFSSYSDKSGKSGGTAQVSVVTGVHKISSELAVLARMGMTNNSPPTGSGGTSWTNPLLGGFYSRPLPNDFRLSVFLAATAPVGSGGGNQPTPSTLAANSTAILARSAMDNALFAVNYFTLIPGVDFAYIANDLTIQLEATLLQLTRVRGEQIDKDASRTNFTSGLEVGYAIHSLLFLEAELRYQRWISHATVFAARQPAKENLSLAFGPRFNFKLDSISIKPGIAYAQGLAGAMAGAGFTSPTHSHHVIFLDVPIFF